MIYFCKVRESDFNLGCNFFSLGEIYAQKKKNNNKNNNNNWRSSHLSRNLLNLSGLDNVFSQTRSKALKRNIKERKSQG